MTTILAACAGVLLGAWAMAVLARQRIRDLGQRLASAEHELRYMANKLTQSYNARQALAAQLIATARALPREKATVPSSIDRP